MQINQRDDGSAPASEDSSGLLDLAVPFVTNAKLLIFGPLAVGMVALAGSFLVAPTYTATTVFLPPQPQQGTAASALSSLGALTGLAGAGGGPKSPAEQYVSLLQSASVTDRLIDEFNLIEAYKAKYRFQARNQLARNVRISLGKKDGLVTVDVDDTDPKRAAALANRHVDELRRLTATLALTEAQQRRVFFEKLLNQSRDALARAQQSLQSSGFSQAALRSEPKAAAEDYAKLKAEVTATEVRVQGLRSALADSSPEMQQQLARLSALRTQLGKLESGPAASPDADYVGRYREFKYQEALFELFARQYEVARVDESREGALIQVIDPAQTPEYKSKPKRAKLAITATVVALLFFVLFAQLRHAWRRASADPANSEALRRLWAGRS